MERTKKRLKINKEELLAEPISEVDTHKTGVTTNSTNKKEEIIEDISKSLQNTADQIKSIGVKQRIIIRSNNFITRHLNKIENEQKRINEEKLTSSIVLREED